MASSKGGREHEHLSAIDAGDNLPMIEQHCAVVARIATFFIV
ncbi:hypothetical protein [Hyphomicrobium facile]|nr:hypothetical protein [Hyphomicrobium facile]